MRGGGSWKGRRGGTFAAYFASASFTTHREPLTRYSNTLKSFFLSPFRISLRSRGLFFARVKNTIYSRVYRECIGSKRSFSNELSRVGGGRGRTKPYVSRHVPRANQPRGFNYPSVSYSTKNQNFEIFVIIDLTNFCDELKKCTAVTSVT